MNAPMNAQCNNWYAVQTKPRQETTAEHNLERQGYTTYLPRIHLRKRRRNQWIELTEPLFARYLFIQVDTEQQSLAPVRSTFGVATLVRFGHLLRPVPDEVIEYLKQAEDQQTQQREDTAWPFEPGDNVAITEGPFAGLPAVFQQKQPEARALLLIDLLGRQNQVLVNMHNIASQ